MIRFAHIRYQDGNNLSTKGGITFAYEFVGTDGTLHVAKSVCSMKDNYNRKIGRAVSAGRLNKGQSVIAKFDDTVHDNVVDFLLDMEWDKLDTVYTNR